MGGINFDPEFSDVLNDNFVGGTISVGTSQVEAKVGANRLSKREYLIIHNSGNNTIYYGPSGVTVSNGVPIVKDQTIGIPIGDIGVFVISSSGTNIIRVQEYA